MLREATADDADELARIDARVNPSAWTVQGFRECLAVYQCLVDATEHGSIAGFVVFSIAGGEAEILNIAVDPLHQRRGMGRALLEAVVALARREKVRRCHLEVRESNARARAFYGAAGFRECGRRKHYYRAGAEREDAILLALDID